LIAGKKNGQKALWPDAPLDLLPEIAWTTDIVGEITREAAKETGLKEGTKVITGTSDAASEAISCGVVENGDLMIMYGTSSFFIEIIDKFVKANRNICLLYFTVQTSMQLPPACLLREQ